MKGDYYEIGKNDLDLAQRLIKAGSEHRKFLRQIFISVDISAPLYWWKEFDTYKVGTVGNSTSTMHKLSSTPITRECFEMGYFNDVYLGSEDFDFPLKSSWDSLINDLEFLRKKYNETKDKRYWKELIRLLPESWLQKRTITMNYENILNMVHQRKNHKLSEWSESFINWAKTLPYADEFFLQ
jgi:Fe-S cluster biosynthesis and repair protein YggX